MQLFIENKNSIIIYYKVNWTEKLQELNIRSKTLFKIVKFIIYFHY